jgi:yecA family protein
MSDTSLPQALLDDEALERLDDFLDSERVDADALDLIGAHGFLVALAVAPCDADPATWVAELFHGEPTFNDEGERETILGLLDELRRNAIAALEQGQLPELPISLSLDGLQAEETPVGDWCAGFMEGVFLEEAAWFEEDEETGTAQMVTDDPTPEAFYLATQDADDRKGLARKYAAELDRRVFEHAIAHFPTSTFDRFDRADVVDGLGDFILKVDELSRVGHDTSRTGPANVMVMGEALAEEMGLQDGDIFEHDHLEVVTTGHPLYEEGSVSETILLARKNEHTRLMGGTYVAIKELLTPTPIFFGPEDQELCVGFRWRYAVKQIHEGWGRAIVVDNSQREYDA